MRHKRAFRGDVTMPAGLLPELLTFQRYIPTVHDADKTHLALESTATGQISRLDEIIISLYAGGMTVRDIDHLLATRGSAPSSPSRRPARWARCPRWSPPTGIVVKVRDGANVGNRAAHTPSGSTRTASGASWGSGFSPVRARSSGCRCGPIWPTATSLCRTSAATALPARRGRSRRPPATPLPQIDSTCLGPILESSPRSPRPAMAFVRFTMSKSRVRASPLV